MSFKPGQISTGAAAEVDDAGSWSNAGDDASRQPFQVHGHRAVIALRVNGCKAVVGYLDAGGYQVVHRAHDAKRANRLTNLPASPSECTMTLPEVSLPKVLLLDLDDTILDD